MSGDDRRRCAPALVSRARSGGDASPNSRGAYMIDVAVIGAGPAGIAAATRAAEAWRRVLLLDEAPNVGGQIWRHRTRASLGSDARRWTARLERTRAEVRRGVVVADVIPDGSAQGFTVIAERHAGGV